MKDKGVWRTAAGGLGGIFRGLSDLVELVREMNERGETRVIRRGEIKNLQKIRNLRGAYEFAVTIGDLAGPSTGDDPVTDVVDCTGVAVTEPVVDVLEETELIRVVAELPGVTTAEISFEARGDVLRLETTGARRYYREVLLPAPVGAEPVSVTYNYGLLEIVLAVERGRCR